MPKNVADEIMEGMIAELEKNGDLLDWFRSKKLDYQGFLSAIQKATSCNQLPSLNSYNGMGAPNPETAYEELTIALEKKRNALTSEGKCI